VFRARMPETGTVIPVPPSQERIEEASKLERPQNFVPSTSVSAAAWGAAGAPARKMVPVGVAGELGSSYTVFEKNWRCEECHSENAATKARCARCRAKKPAGAAGEAAVHSGEAGSGEWREVFDASAKHIYYHNTMTGETQWERPAAMGATIHDSGFFGRGAAGSKAAGGYERNNAAYLARPARKQAEYIASKNTVLEGAYEYNIYWGKYVGEHWGEEKGGSRDPAETRCVVATDAGYTKADKMSRSRHQANFCLFFARGSCALGVECRYFHRVPVRDDHDRLAKDEGHDCFGRERHKDFRDDMTGVGAIMHPCRTLYVGNLVKAEYADPAALEEALWRHFGEWGELENVNLVSRLSIAFVRYRYRASAEFAREAMSNNHLDHSEVLAIRWAHDDPNPVARDAAARADADALVHMLKTRGAAVDDAEFDRPADYAVPPAKRLKADPAEYPDTDAQYDDSQDWRPVADASGTYWWNTKTNETSRDAPQHIADANCSRAMAALDAADEAARRALDPAPDAPTDLDDAKPAADDYKAAPPDPVPLASSRPTEPPLAPGWAQTVDPTSGATYFYNAATRESTWTRPTAAAPDSTPDPATDRFETAPRAAPHDSSREPIPA